MDGTFKLPFYVKFACVLLSILLLGYLCILGQTILLPLILGLLFALLLLPVAVFLERKLKFPRSLASIISPVLFLVVLGLVIYLLGMQLSKLSSEWPAFEAQLKTSFEQMQVWVQQQFGIKQSEQLDYITETAQKSVSTGTGVLGQVLLSMSSIFVLLIFTFLYTFFLLLYRKHIVKFLIINFTKDHHATVMDAVTSIQYMVKKYLIGLFLQMLIVGGLTFIALTIVGVKYAFMLAVITGLLNVLPYVGIATAMLLSCIITFATGNTSHVLFVFISLVVIHAIDGNFVMPKIVGSKVKVNSLFAMIGIVLGEMIWGISGMFLAIPALAICKIVFDRVQGLMPWGFLLGEEDEEPPMFKNILKKLFPDKKAEQKALEQLDDANEIK